SVPQPYSYSPSVLLLLRVALAGLVSACCSSSPAAQDVCSSTQHRCGKPDEHQLCREYLQAPGAEKCVDANGRDPYRSPWEKIACRVKWREEGDTSPPIRHGVENPV